MRFSSAYSSHGGAEAWSNRKLYEWVKSAFDAPSVQIVKGSGPAIREHLEFVFSGEGWAMAPKIDSVVDLSVTAKKSDLAFQVQTGNVSRAAYDLLKLQHLYISNQIEAACLAVPTHTAAVVIGNNLAHFDRVRDELRLFSRQVTVPLLLLTFE